MKKIMVREKIENLGSAYDFENSLDGLIEYLMALQRKYEEKYENLQVNYECKHFYDDSYEFILYGEREETNAEYQKRLNKIEISKKGANAAKINREKKEKELLKKLAKKYPEEINNGKKI